jgi:hypothetical protein
MSQNAAEEKAEAEKAAAKAKAEAEKAAKKTKRILLHDVMAGYLNKLDAERYLGPLVVDEIINKFSKIDIQTLNLLDKTLAACNHTKILEMKEKFTKLLLDNVLNYFKNTNTYKNDEWDILALMFSVKYKDGDNSGKCHYIEIEFVHDKTDSYSTYEININKKSNDKTIKTIENKFEFENNVFSNTNAKNATIVNAKNATIVKSKIDTFFDLIISYLPDMLNNEDVLGFNIYFTITNFDHVVDADPILYPNANGQQNVNKRLIPQIINIFKFKNLGKTEEEKYCLFNISETAAQTAATSAQTTGGTIKKNKKTAKPKTTKEVKRKAKKIVKTAKTEKADKPKVKKQLNLINN